VRRAICAIAITAALAGCATARTSPPSPADPQRHDAAHASASNGAARGGATGATRPEVRLPPEALVTAETENQLAAVKLASGRVARRIALPPDPEFVAADRRVVVVVSPSAGAVTLLHRSSLRPIRILRGFGSPHIAELAPDGRYVYVTDDARGQLAVIRLGDGRLVARIPVGAEAHHMAVRADGHRVWLALGESARTIVIVDTSDPTHPRVVGHFDPGFPVHDLTFTPDDRRVWLTSASGEDMGVFGSRSHRLVDRVPGGAAPQHVVFDGRRAYVASGYGSQIEMIGATSDHVLRVIHAPYGSFNLDAAAGFVTAASLLRGTLAIYDHRLRLRRIVQIAPAARDVAISPAELSR
jgi:DNA-binding beta-propeller fold protein YncE